MTHKEEQKGIALINAIQKKVLEKNLTAKQAAVILGLSNTYYHLIFNARTRFIGSLKPEKLEKIADFLNIPVISVYMLAEIIRPEYFYKKSTLEDQSSLVLDQLLNDTRFSLIAPKKEDLKNWDPQAKLLVAILYQEVANLDILKRAGLIKILHENDL